MRADACMYTRLTMTRPLKCNHPYAASAQRWLIGDKVISLKTKIIKVPKAKFFMAQNDLQIESAWGLLWAVPKFDADDLLQFVRAL